MEASASVGALDEKDPRLRVLADAIGSHACPRLGRTLLSTPKGKNLQAGKCHEPLPERLKWEDYEVHGSYVRPTWRKLETEI